MHTPATDAANGRPGVGDAAKRVADHAKALAGLEVELAAAEMKRKAGALGVGIGMLVGAAVLGWFALMFLFATVAAAFDTFLPLWLALFVTTAILLVIAGILVLIGRWSLRKATPPVPEQAITEARLTTEALKH